MIFKLMIPGLARLIPGFLTLASAKHPAFIPADISPKIAIFGMVAANAARRWVLNGSVLKIFTATND